MTQMIVGIKTQTALEETAFICRFLSKTLAVNIILVQSILLLADTQQVYIYQ